MLCREKTLSRSVTELLKERVRKCPSPSHAAGYLCTFVEAMQIDKSTF